MCLIRTCKCIAQYRLKFQIIHCQFFSGSAPVGCPPISVITSVIQHLRKCGAAGTLLVPVWPSSYFWLIIYPTGTTMAEFVKSFVVIDPYFISSDQTSVFSGYQSFKSSRCVFPSHECTIYSTNINEHITTRKFTFCKYTKHFSVQSTKYVVA